MGYYSELEWDLKLQEDKVKQFKDAVKKIREKVTNGEFDPIEDKQFIESLYYYWLVDLKIDKDRNLVYDDWYAKHYYDEQFIGFIW